MAIAITAIKEIALKVITGGSFSLKSSKHREAQVAELSI